MFPKLEQLKQMRERLGWSQSELAQKVGISQSAIPKYENDKQIPSYEIAVKIFEILIKEEDKMDTDVTEIMNTRIVKVNPNTTFRETKELMKSNSISQIPVVRNNTIIGTITEPMILDLLESYQNLSSLLDAKVIDIMQEVLPTVPGITKIKEVTALIRHYHAVLVLSRGSIVGIVTAADLLEL